MITENEVAAILGSHTTMTEADAMRAIVRRMSGSPAELSDSLPAKYARHHRQGALQEYLLELPPEVEWAEIPESIRGLQRPDITWASARPTAMLLPPAIVEVRCPYAFRSGRVDFPEISEQPASYDRVQFLLWVMKANWADFYQWSPGGGSAERVSPDPEWQAEAIPKLKAFHEQFEKAMTDPARVALHCQPRRRVIDTAKAHALVEAYDAQAAALTETLNALRTMSNDKPAMIAGRIWELTDAGWGLSE